MDKLDYLKLNFVSELVFGVSNFMAGESSRQRNEINGLSSFDVFDTVLTRLVGCPSSVHLLVGARARREGCWPFSAQQFWAARIDAESVARHHVHPCEIDIEQIYAELRFASGLSAEHADACSRIELALEGQLLVAVPAARSLVSTCRGSGRRVAFLSDMYLPSAVVRTWLERAGIAQSSDLVVVSSEAGHTKSSGAAFKEGRRLLGNPMVWQHFGDNAKADVSVPKSLGVDAHQWTVCALTRYEDEMERHAVASGAVASLLAGSARWLRLNHPARDESQAALRDMAAGVAGPVLWAFVAWILKTAAREGKRKIWFTARDGQILLRMARRIAPKIGIEIEMGYLYGGRQVVHLAGLHRIDERAMKWLTGGAGVLAAQALLERVGLNVSSMSDLLQRHGIPREGPIGWDCVGALQDFYRDPDVQAEVLAVASTRRSEMRDYFGACGLMGDEPCAVVDIGWRGSVLRSMFDVIGSENGARHHFLYFGLYGRPADAPEAKMSAFLFELGALPPLGRGYKVPSLMAVMEIFCQADHPQIVHVERHGEDFVPLLRQPPTSHPTLWDVQYFQACLEGYADSVRVDLVEGLEFDLRALSEQLLRLLMEAPGPKEAVVLGSVQYVDDQSGTTAQPFAHSYKFADCREIVRTGVLPLKTLAWWREGAWALTPAATRFWLRVAKRVGRWRRAVGRGRTSPALRGAP